MEYARTRNVITLRSARGGQRRCRQIRSNRAVSPPVDLCARRVKRSTVLMIVGTPEKLEEIGPLWVSELWNVSRSQLQNRDERTIVLRTDRPFFGGGPLDRSPDLAFANLPFAAPRMEANGRSCEPAKFGNLACQIHMGRRCVKHFVALNDDESGRFYRIKVAASKTQQSGR